MDFKWFNRSSSYFKQYPDLLKDTRAVSSFLDEMIELHALVRSTSNQNLLILEIEAEIKWLKENRQDNPIKFD